MPAGVPATEGYDARVHGERRRGDRRRKNVRIAAVGETVPIIGPIVGGIAAFGIALSASPKLAIAVGAYFLVLHQLEANVLVPKIMERRVGVSPVTVMVALLIGGALWGIVGAILAIPTAAILSVVIDEFAPGADPVVAPEAELPR